MSKYDELRKINVGEHIEKKNNLSYLSWAWAVDVLLQQDANATWSYSEPAKFGETLMVFCTVKAFDKEMTAQLPVMDFRNKAIPNPDAFAVNTAMQRCLAKAIALHGLGLYIYAGEDLPDEDKDAIQPKQSTNKAPNLQPPPLTSAEFEACINELGNTFDMETLKGIFGGAYKRANEEQKPVLTTHYNNQKLSIEGK